MQRQLFPPADPPQLPVWVDGLLNLRLGGVDKGPATHTQYGGVIEEGPFIVSTVVSGSPRAVAAIWHEEAEVM